MKNETSIPQAPNSVNARLDMFGGIVLAGSSIDIICTGQQLICRSACQNG